MKFVIYNGGEKVAEVKDAVPTAKIAEMFGAGTEVFVRSGYSIENVGQELTPVAQIDVTGQTVNPEILERRAAATC